MNKNSSKILNALTTPWALVASLVAGFGLISLINQRSSENSPADNIEHYPQTFMIGVETREFTAKGELQHLLQTPRITHYQMDPETPGEQDYTIIDHPQVAFYDAGEQSPWVLTARSGHSNANNSLLRLIDDVVIQQDTTMRGLVQITTSELLVYPQQQFAETEKAVKMRSPKGQMDAVGMVAYMQENRVQLKSQVRAIYEMR